MRVLCVLTRACMLARLHACARVCAVRCGDTSTDVRPRRPQRAIPAQTQTLHAWIAARSGRYQHRHACALRRELQRLEDLEDLCGVEVQCATGTGLSARCKQNRKRASQRHMCRRPILNSTAVRNSSAVGPPVPEVPGPRTVPACAGTTYRHCLGEYSRSLSGPLPTACAVCSRVHRVCSSVHSPIRPVGRASRRAPAWCRASAS